MYRTEFYAAYVNCNIVHRILLATNVCRMLCISQLKSAVVLTSRRVTYLHIPFPSFFHCIYILICARFISIANLFLIDSLLLIRQTVVVVVVEQVWRLAKQLR